MIKTNNIHLNSLNMRTTITQKMMLLAIMMVAGAGNLLADVGNAFAIMTKEGVMMTFMINDET